LPVIKTDMSCFVTHKCFLKTPAIAAKKATQEKSRVKSPTKANTDLHDDELNIFNKRSTSKLLLILNKNSCRRITEIKSIWVVITKAGNAVCGVV